MVERNANKEMSGRKKLFITGANGFVAGSVLTQAGDGWQVHAISRGEKITQRTGLDWHTCDPRSPEQLAELFRSWKPDAVIHTAAVADIDYCQAHPEKARAANVDFTRALVELCAESGAKLVFCSTDTVFDGEHAPYGEGDEPGPVNFYAETKIEAEKLVIRLGPQAIIARLSLVVGLPVLGAGNSFLARMIAALKEGRTVAVPEREVRTPVDVLTVGKALLELAGSGHCGMVHLAGHDRLNRLEMARRIAARFGYPQNLVTAQAATASPGRAPRPRDVSLDNSKACAMLRTPMLNFDEALSLILENSAAHSP